jgi:hypothetical protein
LAETYFKQLLSMASDADSDRAAIATARSFVGQNGR